jgi:hypothetical protein
MRADLCSYTGFWCDANNQVKRLGIKFRGENISQSSRRVAACLDSAVGCCAQCVSLMDSSQYGVCRNYRGVHEGYAEKSNSCKDIHSSVAV